MRTILAGFRALRRAPLAGLPLVIEGLIGASLVASGAIPDGGAGVTSTAVFPLDVFFDVKQSLAFSRNWTYVIAALGLGVFVRGGVLAATLWLGEGRPGSFALAWARASRLVFFASLLLFPSAVLFFAGVATRYAPFVWIGALVGLAPSALLVRRAAKLDVGSGEPQGSGVPEVPGFMAYVYIVTAFGAAMSALSDAGVWGPVLVLALVGPVHALFLLGWREHTRNGTFPGGGTIVTIVSLLAVLALFVLAGYDRFVRDPAPVRRAPARGMLLVLQGVDSTSRRGALASLDPRTLGFRQNLARQLSYVGAGKPYRASDTRQKLEKSARIISRQIATAQRPRSLVGHSQAGLVLDRMIELELPIPERALLLATPPSKPPTLSLPPPNKDGVGRPAGDLSRVLAAGLEGVGAAAFDIDAASAPTNLETVVASRARTPRLSVWALADSVWLEGDWRRPGEINLIAVTDHVGVTDNGFALEQGKEFFAGERVEDDETSWKSVAVGVLRYAFDPWKPR